MNYLLQSIICTLLLVRGICTSEVVAQTVIFNINPSAKPGEAISLQGNFESDAKIYLTQGTATTPIPLHVLVQSTGQATVQIPARLDLDLYKIWVEEKGQRSPGVYVNKPYFMHLDSPEVTPGGDLRIFGRNLQLRSGSSNVRFVDQNGTDVHVGVVDTERSDQYILNVKVPASLQPGTNYNLFVSNGFGGEVGETRMEQTVLAINTGLDYFKLGVPWAAKFDFYKNVYNVKTDPRLSLKAVGDGQTNDQPAIQGAINRANADGGGIVYLPAGTYKLLARNSAALTIRNRVVIQGVDKDQTFIKFGYDISNPRTGVVWPPITNQSGLADLSLINVDSTAQWTGNMTGQCTEVFLQRVFIDLSRGEWLMWAKSNKLVIANSIITQGLTSNSGYRGPLQLNGCAHFVVSGNTFTYAVDGLNLNDAHDGVFENNRVYRDGAARYPTGVINHVLILNFAENIAVLANEFKVINGPAQNSNDGETIIAEGGGPDRIDEDAGIMSDATSVTITDKTKNWANIRRRPVVAIVNGKGMGQWRTITSRTANMLTIDRPWDVVPAAGSHYAIFNWGARNWLLQGNTMEGNRRGITLYHNATNQVAIINNTLVNNGSIDLAPIQQERGGTNLSQQFIPMYNNQIIGNLVSNTNGQNGVFIGVHSVQFIQEKTFGTSVIGLEVRNNTLTAGQPNVPAIVDAGFPEGYLNYLQYQPGAARYVEEQIPAILGSIFQNNTAINCDHALYLNSGSYNTLVCNLKLKNSTILLKDDRLDRVSHASIRTASCLTDISAELPEVVTIYPNPATTELHIEMSEAGAHFRIYSVLGILLLESDTAESEADIDVQRLPVGSYLLVVQFKKGNQTSQRFIKQRF
ncbi:T9SS type A sorting domain-containing protein [Spirosoma utsteinense]|uniref:T9SS type A sorting domain-containing protein n=1 Tax=Spirosoma utsteinense TaxID=2585773 RepID=A0ABR6WDE4_9BACT|nr:T9SS type A sorting domain-containing protein [Spirosoma utsteinense]MBC3788536.1 hypothetical protein [Spirosoma utsteinense]MBC3794572.1 hypothetical protein [Spirosoma utsteinense]